MRVNADVAIHRGHLQHLITSNRPMEKLDSKGDPRLVPGGWVIRALGLDELPQLINVLRGEMSLVGPRPCIPYEYEAFPPQYRHRCDTLPGLTGLWQVNGKNRLTFEQMMDFDLLYVRDKSLFLDLQILARTIPALVVQASDAKKRRASSAKGEAVLGRTPSQTASVSGAK
jgi:lipopolysaccharide/colanic/teichoic acid biosynthesis glycosyltransferase